MIGTPDYLSIQGENVLYNHHLGHTSSQMILVSRYGYTVSRKSIKSYRKLEHNKLWNRAVMFWRGKRKRASKLNSGKHRQQIRDRETNQPVFPTRYKESYVLFGLFHHVILSVQTFRMFPEKNAEIIWFKIIKWDNHSPL
jgi:hypothetical protein